MASVSHSVFLISEVPGGVIWGVQHQAPAMKLAEFGSAFGSWWNIDE